MEKVKVSVVGLGWIAQVVHLPILKKSTEVELVAVCDRDKGRARLVAEKFGVKKHYTDFAQLLTNEECDAVIVCTSTDAHKDIAIPAMKAGKDVLVEKPIARHFVEAVAMADAAKECKHNLMVGMNHRFRPDAMLMKSFVEGGELGAVMYAKSGWLRRRENNNPWMNKKAIAGGGVFLDLGLVMFDLAFWMLSYPEVKRVSASTFQQKNKEVEDTSIVHLHMKDGLVLDIEASWSTFLSEDVYYCNIYGRQGTASLNPLRINKELHGSLVNLAPARLESPQHFFRRSYENEINHFIGAVKGYHSVVSTGDEAVQRMRIVDAVYKSAKTGKEVTLSKN
ncbi:MAG: Gfo/Idh/MocA family oxidoreductase [Ignavibacteriae bacterium]|nr:Gfo/Idh/MocA family oxidoreductase [Ignavibacteriota bacterium]